MRCADSIGELDASFNCTNKCCIQTILYFAWEDQSEKVRCTDHTVVINCITVLHEPYSTVMHLISSYIAVMQTVINLLLLF